MAASMKRFILFSLLFLTVSIVIAGTWYLSHYKKHKTVTSLSLPEKKSKSLLEQARKAKAFVKEEKYNDSICFLVDMSLASGTNRFFVYNMKNNSLIDAGLVTHGRCNKDFLTGRQYGNEVGCGCTSLGKYKIGNPYQGRFGLAYKLHGLDSSNSNAFKRYVVLHSHSCVPSSEVDPAPICQSDGCPTVSPAFLQKLAGILDNSKKPLLLWMYE